MDGVRYYHEEQIQKGDKVASSLQRKWAKRSHLIHLKDIDITSLNEDDLKEELRRLQKECREINMFILKAKQDYANGLGKSASGWYFRINECRDLRTNQIQDIEHKIQELKLTRKNGSVVDKDKRNKPCPSNTFSKEEWDIFYMIFRHITNIAKYELEN